MLRFRFQLTDLLFLTAYFAVAAWLISMGVRMGALIWIGSAFGFEIGKRSDYSTILITLCGAVMGLGLVVAVFCTNFIFLGVGGRGRFSWPHLALVGSVWLMVISIFLWLCFRVKKKAVN